MRITQLQYWRNKNTPNIHNRNIVHSPKLGTEGTENGRDDDEGEDWGD